ncbi:MAG: hypothetical protein JWO20_1906 [Candidatus Angelobacter sp.]|jgi:hypothetical protein|nr:hypothetical protein [Candidatus Angelobacter sp.]
MTRPFSVTRSTSSVRILILGLFAVFALALAAPAFAQDPYGGSQNGNQYPVSRGPAYPNGNNGPYGSYNAPNAIPEGTRFIAVLDDKLETQKIQPGKKFKLKLAEDLMSPNGQVIPRGKKIKGHVSNVDRGFHGRILLSFDEIETKHGWVPLVATVTGVPGEHGVNQTTGNEGEIERRGADKRRAIESAAIGAGVGAVAGGVAAGGKGAAIGAAAGGALGAGAGILTDRDLTLNKGTQLELQLDRQLVVPQ